MLHMHLFFYPASGFWEGRRAKKNEFYIHKIYWNKIFRTVNRTTKNRNKTNGRKYFSFSLLLLLLLHPLFFLCCVCFFFEPQCVEEQKICNIIIILHISSIYESRDQHPLMYMYRYILVMGHSTFFFQWITLSLLLFF